MTDTAARNNMVVLGLCCVLLFNIYSAVGQGPLTKCLQRPEANPKYTLRYERQSWNLTVQASSRVTHQLSSHVFKIYLEEVQNYTNIEVVTIEDHFDAEKVIEILNGNFSEDHVKSMPEAMVNLEVWIPPEMDTVSTLGKYNVLDAGTLSTPGRVGWFIPKKFAPLFDNPRSPVADDIPWTYFKNQTFAAKFHIADKKKLGEPILSAETCTQDLCRYIPKMCEDTNCATLLAPTYLNTTFLVEQIIELELYVEIVWLGEHLKQAVKKIQSHYSTNNIAKGILIMAWIPSDIIFPEEDFSNVVFPKCNENLAKYGCKYEMMRLEKLTWSKLDKSAEAALEAVRRIEFSKEAIGSLLSIYEKHHETENYETMACRWLKENNSTWMNWVTKERPKNIYIGGIFPISKSSYKGHSIIRSVKRAVRKIKESRILGDYSLELLVADGQCRADKVMRSFIDYVVDVNYYDKMIGVLGPACSDTVEPLAGVSKHYNTLVISYSAEGASFSDREKYPYFFRTIGSNSEFKHIYLKLLQTFGWKRVASLTEDGQKYTEYISHMRQLLEDNGITFVVNSKFPRESKNFMKSYLEDLKSKRARIIIADVFDEVARSVMCEAHRLDMTLRHGYVWFLPTWLNESWYDTDYFNANYNESVNCSTKIMIEAINGYFSITPAFWGPEDSIIPENTSVGEWKKSMKGEVGQLSDYAGFAYDAVWTYAYALQDLLENDREAITDLHSANTTSKLVKFIQKTDFDGVTGRISFPGGSSRYSIINLNQWTQEKNRTTVGEFRPNISSTQGIIDGTLILNDSAIIWLSDEMPDDGGNLPPETCSLDFLAKSLNVGCEMAIVVLCFIIFSIVLGLISVWICLYKKKVESRMVDAQKIMQALGLDPDGKGISDLDKWEIPRENVVINRKLGEGAFGTVYGGEALIIDVGWIAVAVKTLKVGSSSDEKLDFLSEAESMKRFDHQNIVKLIGVCIKSEPVYTIMEFMLYGDLKTYLLSRRNLVNPKKSEENDEVSSKRLTSMAIDVARALSYLCEMKYVHRDVACRNCLVNMNRTVKLGDFGMTRAMFDSDYYRFNRKGMLPVRWMAPESLTDGVFAPNSDVWSYGVLLYEIITFGSFPFQGLSNSQVLEYVKEGHTLDIPKGVRPQLEMLLKSCWNREAKKRPLASEIVDFLANNPNIISPCLDGPIASVALEGSGDCEVLLPQEFRKPSTIITKNFPQINDTEPSLIDFSDKSQRDSAPDSGVSIQMDYYCPREPLLPALGPKAISLTGLSYVTIKHNHSHPNLLSDDHISDYIHPKANNPQNGFIVSKC